MFVCVCVCVICVGSLKKKKKIVTHFPGRIDPREFCSGGVGPPRTLKNNNPLAGGRKQVFICSILLRTFSGGVEYALRMAPRRAHALLCTWAALRLGPAADEADADEQDAARRTPADEDCDQAEQ